MLGVFQELMVFLFFFFFFFFWALEETLEVFQEFQGQCRH